jgi:hypothetical protein
MLKRLQISKIKYVEYVDPMHQYAHISLPRI